MIGRMALVKLEGQNRLDIGSAVHAIAGRAQALIPVVLSWQAVERRHRVVGLLG